MTPAIVGEVYLNSQRRSPVVGSMARNAPYAFDAGITLFTSCLPGRAPGSTADESSAFPLRGRDILRALHILRC